MTARILKNGVDQGPTLRIRIADSLPPKAPNLPKVCNSLLTNEVMGNFLVQYQHALHLKLYRGQNKAENQPDCHKQGNN